MIFKNDPQKESVALKRYVKKIVLLYSMALIVSVIASVAAMLCFEDKLRFDWWTLIFPFVFIILFFCFVSVKGYKRAKKNYSSFSLEITDGEIIINTNSNETRVKISEIKQMAKTNDSTFLLSTGNISSGFYVRTENIENSDELLSRLNQMMEQLSNGNEYTPSAKDRFINFFFGKKIFLVLGILISVGFIFRNLPIVPPLVRFLLTLAFGLLMITLAILLSRSPALNRKHKVLFPIMMVFVWLVFLAEEIFNLL